MQRVVNRNAGIQLRPRAVHSFPVIHDTGDIHSTRSLCVTSDTGMLRYTDVYSSQTNAGTHIQCEVFYCRAQRFLPAQV